MVFDVYYVGGEMSGPTESMMGLNIKPQTSMSQKVKLKSFNFVFKLIDLWDYTHI